MLAGATAAVFICASAGAMPVVDPPPVEDPPPIIDPPEIQIVQMGLYYPLSSDAIEGEWHTVYASTNMPYHQVKWYVNGDLKKTYTNTPPTSNTYSYFDYEYDGLGSTAGNNVTIKAVATGWDIEFGSATKEMTLTVWDPIRINYFQAQRKCVEGEKAHMSLETNIPFSRLEYSVDGGDMIPVEVSGSSNTQISFYHIFEDGGSNLGSEHTIKAVAYATVAGRETSADDTDKSKVYAGNGYIWTWTYAYLDSIATISEENHEYELETHHYVSYYNDTGEAPTDSVKTKIGWREEQHPDDPRLRNRNLHGSETLDPLTQKLAFSASEWFDGNPYKTRKKTWTLTPGWAYGINAYTNLTSDGKAQAVVDSPVGAADPDVPLVEYDLETMTLPATGGYTSITNEAAKFLSE